MRVGFDVTPIAAHAPRGPFPPGVRRPVATLVAKLEERGRLEVVRVCPAPGEDARAWSRRGAGEAVTRGGLLGIHSFTSGFPWRGAGRRVQTVHELPWRHGVSENAGWRHRAWAALGPALADRVVCPTEHVARDLRRRLLPGASRVRVVPWGVGPEFADEPPPGVVDEVVYGRYRLSEDPLVLCLGATRAKKHLAAAMRGLAEVRRRDGPAFQLVVTGPETEQLRRDLGLASQLGLARWVTTLPEVDEGDLPSLYRLACCTCVLSHSEGFGLPALESIACGTPVLVPPDSAQAEVAGPCSIAVDPLDPVSVADGLCAAHARREELRLPLAERGREFSWDACAQRVEDLWEELA